MLVLWKRTPQTVGSLENMLYLDSGTLTPLLERMEHAGLISRTRDAKGERRVLIESTTKGSALRHTARRVPKQLAAGVDMNEASIVELREHVRSLVAVFQARLHLAD